MNRWTAVIWGVLLVVAVGSVWLGEDHPSPRRTVEPTPGRWRYIVLHHSATKSGNAEIFGREHRRQRGWDELGYHFVIDNGRGGPDGRVEVGPRWTRQKHGAHTGGTAGDEYNRHGIGICLVGDFTNHGPSRAQLTALADLLGDLMKTHGIPAANVIGHGEAPGTNTECPGRTFLKHVRTTLRPGLEGAEGN